MRNLHFSSFALVVARSGSARLHHKNKLLLNGKPLFVWTVESALDSRLFDEVWISSDDVEILELSSNIPGLNIDKRPSELCGSEISCSKVLQYFIEKMRREGKYFQTFCMLQPTSPLRKAKHIRQIMEELDSEEVDFAVGIQQYKIPPHFALDIQEGLEPVIDDSLTQITHTQRMPSYYHPAGGIFAGKVEPFLRSGHFYGKRSRGIILDVISGWDINDHEDLKVAEYFASELR